MILKPNQILITVGKDYLDVEDFRKKETLNNAGLCILYLQRMFVSKQRQVIDNVEHIPEFEVDSIVTLKSNPGGTLFKVRRNVDMYSVVEKTDRSSLEKSCDMIFYIQRVSLVEHKEKKNDSNFNKLDHYHMHYDSAETCEKCKEKKNEL